MSNPILDTLNSNGTQPDINTGIQNNSNNPILSTLPNRIVSSTPQPTPQLTPGPKQSSSSVWNTVRNFGSAILKSAENVPSYLLQGIKNPLQFGEGAVSSAVLKPLGFIEGITNNVLKLENRGLNALGVKTQAPVNVFSGAAQAISNIKRTQNQQKAFDTGNFFGWFVPYSKVTKGAELALDTLKLTPKLAKLVPVVADAVGFLGTGQILHTKVEIL